MTEDKTNVIKAISDYGEAMAIMAVARYEYRKSIGSKNEDTLKSNLDEMRARVAQKKLQLSKTKLSAGILLSDLNTCRDFLDIDDS